MRQAAGAAGRGVEGVWELVRVSVNEEGSLVLLDGLQRRQGGVVQGNGEDELVCLGREHDSCKTEEVGGGGTFRSGLCE